METVTRKQFADFIKPLTLPGAEKVWENPIQTESRSVMQYVSIETNEVLAQAIYVKGCKPQYQIRTEDK